MHCLTRMLLVMIIMITLTATAFASQSYVKEDPGIAIATVNTFDQVTKLEVLFQSQSPNQVIANVGQDYNLITPLLINDQRSSGVLHACYKSIGTPALTKTDKTLTTYRLHIDPGRIV